jgi:hypothetical protein
MMTSTSSDMALRRFFASHQVHGASSFEIGCLNEVAPYLFTVDAVNAARIAPGDAVVARQP